MVIVAEKPFRAVRVIADASDEPGETAAGEEALMAKSRKLKVVVVECVSDPLVPVIVSV
jgi:hypothetical protein